MADSDIPRLGARALRAIPIFVGFITLQLGAAWELTFWQSGFAIAVATGIAAFVCGRLELRLAPHANDAP